MSAKEPPANAPGQAPGLDLVAIVRRLPQPGPASDLAARIVARATLLPQQEPRETVVSAVPAIAARPARSIRARGPVALLGLGSALAAAASLALLLLPSPAPESAPPARQAPATPADMAIARPAALAADVPKASGEKPVRPDRTLPDAPHAGRPPPRQGPAGEPDALLADAAAPVPEPIADTPIADAPGAAALPAATASPAPLAEASGPKAPVQGPPVPAELLPLEARGLGVAGSIEGGREPPAGQGSGHGGGPMRGGGGGPHR